jgi:hypothetical protein
MLQLQGWQSAGLAFVRQKYREYAAGLYLCLNKLFKFQIVYFKFQISNFKFQISNFKFQISNFKFQISNFKFQSTIFNDIKILS